MTGLNPPVLRTIDVARATGYSVQHIRDLERLGVIPPGLRSATGYRSFAPIHVHAVRAYRGLAGAAGPVAARRLLPQLLAGSVESAAAAICEVYVGLAQERSDVLYAQDALHAIASEATDLEEDTESDAMTISGLASALGVRPSTLRYWEAEGLAVPERVTALHARSYVPAVVREARIVVALRGAGYGIPAVRDVMNALRRFEGIGGVQQILQGLLDTISSGTVSLLRAGSDLAAVIEAAFRPPQ
ncbi:MerR family transcriptional regulator [Arthrobacter sp. 35W]|uniref:MerR family transcriptional regulator n=1 Tax=Arthrobacter sp. 35W TaxID=1132441 RepID=UPI000419B8A2|nr:MerR family transcriptional regulator [Arthrobacter sp. 35W]